MNPGDALPGLDGIPTTEPAFGLPAVWIEEGARAEAEALGYTVVDAESVVVTHLTETIRRHADELLTRQETRSLLDALKEANAAAVEEIVPDRLGVGEVQRVLQTLLREGVSIRDLGTILEAIGDKSIVTREPAALAEHARLALARQIVARYIGDDGVLQAITLDPSVEEEVADSLMHTPDGELLALDPERAGSIVAELVRARPGRLRHGPPRRARLLEPRAPPPAPPDRAVAAAAARARVHRDRPRHPRRGRRAGGGGVSLPAVDIRKRGAR